jgi:hypothetical protein
MPLKELPFAEVNTKNFDGEMMYIVPGQLP